MMKMILIFTRNRKTLFLLLAVCLMAVTEINAQVCASPATTIYGLTGNGEIYPINVSNAAIGTVVKNSTYSGNTPNKSNSLAYNSTNGKFYYFKRNVGGSAPIEFVSYDPATATVTVLTTSTSCTGETHTGCVTADGLGYYTFDTDANLSYYNILTNTWTFITNVFKDQDGNDVTSVIKSQNAGDCAFDGNGNLWLVTSDNNNFGVYVLTNPPKTAVSSLTLYRRVSPTTSTPSGKSIAGIAFNPSGQIFMATKNDNRLYRLENNLSLTFIGTFSVSDIGNDLTSCVFPLAVLPVTWVDFSAILKNNKEVKLSWQIAEKPYAGFYVQHSQDGKTWTDIAFEATLETDVEGKVYTYTHQSPVTGQNFYRIKTLNELGKERYSEVKAVMLKQPGAAVTLWPNPASDYLNISGSNDQLRNVRIYDLSGRMQVNAQLKPGESSVSVTMLKSGTYMLSVYAADGSKESKTFIKQ